MGRNGGDGLIFFFSISSQCASLFSMRVDGKQIEPPTTGAPKPVTCGEGG